MSGHIVRVTLSNDDVAFRFECCGPSTCDVRADDGKCWPTNYAGEFGRLEEFYDPAAPEVALNDGASVEFHGGFDPEEWVWRIVAPTPRAEGEG